MHFLCPMCREASLCDRMRHVTHGADKVWLQLNCEGIHVARCTVARLMRKLGLRAVIRGKGTRTTISDKATPCPLDKVNRQFRAARPNAL